MSSAESEIGHVYLIGAGPGDPGLLTLRGAELLANSDVVLYDGLSNRELLRHAPSATHICVGKHGQSRIWKQSEIIQEMLSHAMAGRVVSRLKGGDPAVFARTAEEVDALLEAGVPFQIVPGITAALAAGSYAGIPVTHRKIASAVALVTGHEEPGKSQSALDWEALANFPGTLVIYMGVTTVGAWSKALLDAGKPPETPAAIVRRCSHGDQQTVICTLAEISQLLTPASKIRPPVIVILGPVAKLAETMDWIGQRPLVGITVLVTRPEQQADLLARPLRERGANVLCQPAIQVLPPSDWGPIDEAIENLKSYGVVVFCSRNGVKYFMQRVHENGLDARAFFSNQIAAVGAKTAKELASYGLKADLVPQEFTATSLAELLAKDHVQKRVLILRASRGGTELPDSLEQIGAQVDEVVCYRNEDVEDFDPQVLAAIANGQVDWITVTSSATARNLHRVLGDSMRNCKLASLSPVTSHALTELGYQVAAEANPYTVQSMIESIVDAEGAVD